MGSPALEDLLYSLKPSYWFAAHLHCKFGCVVKHDDTEKTTKFLALSLIGHPESFLQILNIGDSIETELEIEYDLEWLTILFHTNHLLSVSKRRHYLPRENSGRGSNFTPTDSEKEAVLEKFNNSLKVPLNFVKTAPVYAPKPGYDYKLMTFNQPKPVVNPQTTLFCDTLGIDDPLLLAKNKNSAGKNFNRSHCYR